MYCYKWQELGLNGQTNMEENVYNFSVSNTPADGLVPWGTEASAFTVLTDLTALGGLTLASINLIAITSNLSNLIAQRCTCR